MQKRVMLLITVLMLMGCTSTLTFNTYPPGARVTAAQGSCVVPCTLTMRWTPKELSYRLEKHPLYQPKEGTIHARIAPGRIFGAIFTLGIVFLAKGIYYFPPAQAQLEPTVDPGGQLAMINEPGTGRIEGQAFTETRGGEVRHATGDTVTLQPDTAYVRDAIQYLAFESQPRAGLVTSIPNLQFLDTSKRQTIADADGRFAFEGLVPGKYIVSAVISWEASAREGVFAPQFVSVVGFADVNEGGTTKAIVTDWTAQQQGIGRSGETVIPPIGSDTEKTGQRVVPDQRPAQ